MLAAERVVAVAVGGRAVVTPLAGGTLRLALPLSHAGWPVLVAVGQVPAVAAGSETEQVRLQKWAQAVAERLRLSDDLFTQPAGGAEPGPVAPGTVAWEALLTLDQLIRRTRINKEAAPTAHRILEGALGLLPVRALAWVPPQPAAAPVALGEGLTPGDWRQLAAVLSQGAGETPEPVLCNDVARAWGQRFAGVRNLLALPVPDHAAPGWVIAVNKRTKDDGQSGAALRPRSFVLSARATPPC